MAVNIEIMIFWQKKKKKGNRQEARKKTKKRLNLKNFWHEKFEKLFTLFFEKKMLSE